MAGNKIGYTTWGSLRGGCGHIHEQLEEGMGCIERDQYWVSTVGGDPRPERWIYRLALYPGDEIMRRPLSSEDKSIVRQITIG